MLDFNHDPSTSTSTTQHLKRQHFKLLYQNFINVPLRIFCVCFWFIFIMVCCNFSLFFYFYFLLCFNLYNVTRKRNLKVLCVVFFKRRQVAVQSIHIQYVTVQALFLVFRHSNCLEIRFKSNKNTLWQSVQVCHFCFFKADTQLNISFFFFQL